MPDEGRGDDVYQPDGSDTDNPPTDDLDPENVIGEPDLDEMLDTGYSPPEKPLGVTKYGTTGEEQREGESLDRRLAQEVPEDDPLLTDEPHEGPEDNGPRRTTPAPSAPDASPPPTRNPASTATTGPWAATSASTEARPAPRRLRSTSRRTTRSDPVRSLSTAIKDTGRARTTHRWAVPRKGEKPMSGDEIEQRKVLAVVTNYGVEQDELLVPLEHLRGAGARVDVAAVSMDDILTLVGDKDPGKTVRPDLTLDDADPADYDLLLIPGGTLNADTLRLQSATNGIIRSFTDSGRPVAAICHGPWALVEAGVVPDKRLTSYPSLRTDIRNAGGEWTDEPVVTDGSGGWTLITSRNPGDLEPFVREIRTALGARP